MAVRDQVSKMATIQALNAAISTNTTTNGSIIDTADFENGLSFFLSTVAYTDGSFTLSLQESSASDMAGAVTVDSTKLIGTFPAAAAATAAGGTLGKVGVHSNLRYVRPQIVSTGTTSGATINVACVQHGENLPI